MHILKEKLTLYFITFLNWLHRKILLTVYFIIYFCADAEAPTNLELQQNGRFSIEIRWTAPANPPSQGYRISTREDVSAGFPADSSPYTFEFRNDQTSVTIRVVGLSLHFHSDVLGPESITLRGENILYHSKYLAY